MKFWGYRRPDGLVGIRNHVLILPTVGCANETCRIIAGLVNGAVTFVNQNGCGEVEGNRKLTQAVWPDWRRIRTSTGRYWSDSAANPTR